MATINKDFKIKQGLIVEGATATVNGLDILTKKQADQDYIVGLIGGTATSVNTADTVVKRDGSGNFAAGTITATLTGNVTGNLTGNVTGQVSSLANHDTADLAENASNKYFTDARALTATAAAYDVAGAAAAAQSAATTAAASDATTKVAAEAALRVSGDAASVSTASADATAKVAAEAALRVSGDSATLASAASDATTKASAAQAAAATYTDNSVAALVDGAPGLLNTLNELADAIGDDANFATTLTTSVGTKVSKAGDTMTGLLVLSADPAANLGAATKQYVDAAEADAVTTASADATSKANAAQSAAQAAAAAAATTYTDAEITDALVTAQGYASTAQGNAQTFATNAINGLDTDDIEEGATNLYFTDVRAKASAASLLTGATLSNITITGNGAGLTITAENGVADSTTSDLAEGTNLYFTDARAVDALEAHVPNFTAVEINSVAKEVAATATIATAGTATALSWAKADYKTAKALVKFATATHTEVSEILLTLDSSDNVAITEYAEIATNGAMGTVTATVVGGDVRINVTTLNNATTVIVKATLLA